MDNDICFSLNPWILESYGNVIDIDKNGKCIKFFSRAFVCKTIVVRSDQPLVNSNLYSWTIKVQKSSGDEMSVGIATDKDFSSVLHFGSCLGVNGQSWVLSSFGRICHNNVALEHADYVFCKGDYITVYLDMIKKTLMFAINMKLIGYQYVDLPSNVNIHPIVAASKFCEMQLVCSHASQPSLILLSLTTYIIYVCKSKARKVKKMPSRLPKDSKFLWYGLVPVDRFGLPPGLINKLEVLHPTLVTKSRSAFKEENFITPYSPPKVLKLENPKKSSRRRLERFVQPPTRYGHDPLSSGNYTFQFSKRRYEYDSSSDDEIFPEIARKRKMNLKRIQMPEL